MSSYTLENWITNEYKLPEIKSSITEYSIQCMFDKIWSKIPTNPDNKNQKRINRNTELEGRLITIDLNQLRPSMIPPASLNESGLFPLAETNFKAKADKSIERNKDIYIDLYGGIRNWIEKHWRETNIQFQNVITGDYSPVTVKRSKVKIWCPTNEKAKEYRRLEMKLTSLCSACTKKTEKKNLLTVCKDCNFQWSKCKKENIANLEYITHVANLQQNVGNHLYGFEYRISIRNETTEDMKRTEVVNGVKNWEFSNELEKKAKNTLTELSISQDYVAAKYPIILRDKELSHYPVSAWFIDLSHVSEFIGILPSKYATEKGCHVKVSPTQQKENFTKQQCEFEVELNLASLLSNTSNNITYNENFVYLTIEQCKSLSYELLLILSLFNHIATELDLTTQ